MICSMCLYDHHPSITCDAAARGRAEHMQRLEAICKAAQEEEMREPRCDNCRFYLRQACHRFPPAVGGSSYVAWPHTRDDDWCGEHDFKG